MNKFYSGYLNRLDLFGKTDLCSNSPNRWRISGTGNLVFALLLFGMLLSTGFSFAQSISNYAFTSGTTGSLKDLSAEGTSYLIGVNDDAAGTVQPLGFDFIFMGMKYTHFSANSNGQMMLHTSSTATAIGTNVSTALNAAILAPFTGDNEVGNGMRFKVIGTAPNRTFVLEWNQFYVNYQNLSNAGNMQAWLEETTGKITYMYGEIYNSAVSTQSRSISLASSNTATTVGSVTIGAVPVFTTGTTLTVNTIAIGTNPIGSPLIANIGSSSNGNRVFYTFTATTTLSGDVTSLTFSDISGIGTTLNWTDNATNEVGFFVTRATDAAFTQNVSTSFVASTTTVGTGTSYTSAQTSLSAGTSYYYKVVAVVEARASIGITGSQATLNGANYYWTGATGGAWNTYSNWNTSADGSGTVPTAWATSDVHIIDGAGSASGGELTISVDRTNFTVGQIKIISNTNLTLESSATTTRTITVSGGPNDDFVLETGSALNLNSATKAIALAFTGVGNTGLIAGAYTASGSTSNLITSSGGTGTLVKVTSTGSVTSTLNSSSAALVGSITTLLFENGSNYTHSNSTTTNYIPTATWQANATATLNGNTTGTSLTSNSTSLGNLVINMTASTATFSPFTSNVRTILGNLTINSTGTTGKFRAITSGVLTIKGNLAINAGTFEVGSLGTGGVIVEGNTSVANGAILDISQSTLQNGGNMINNGSVLSSETTTSTSKINFIGTTVPQTFSGNGTFTGRISSFGVSNPMGLTLSTPVLTQRVNLFSGTITGSSNITIGNGLALSAAVQIGVADNTTSGGVFDVAPAFNIGTGAFTLIYSGETTPRTTGFEVPPTRSVTNLSVDNVNGLTLAGGTIEVSGTLALTNGIVNSSAANHILHGSASAEGILTGGSSASYINGPIVRTVADANTGFVLFPVGKSTYSPVSLSPATTSVAAFKAEAFGVNTGTANPAIINLSANRRWETSLVSGTFTTTKVLLGDALIGSTNIPVQGASASGIYTSSYGSTASFIAGTPNTIESVNAVNSSDFTGFFSFAQANVCNGTPNPGNTLSSVATICLGESVNLSLQNDTPGSGVTYQWKSSTDNVTYSNIVGAISSTLTVVPTAATYYLAEVTCTASSSTTASTAVQIAFTNTVTNITAAARCGEGTVTLGATPSAGSSISWYANATGGTPLASGSTFTTPVISETTTYYASANTGGTVNAQVGTAATIGINNSLSPFNNYWSNAKYQIIYTASELNSLGVVAGTINSMGYTTTTLGSAGTNSNYTVKIATTNLTSFATSAFVTGAFTTCYGPSTYTHTAAGLQTITFDTPFIWDGNSNIIVEVSMSGANASASANTLYTETADNTVVYSYNANTTISLSKLRFNTLFGTEAICSSPRKAITATVASAPALTLSAATTNTCSGIESSSITLTSNAANYDTYVWTPATGVSGNSTIGWTFAPAENTTYTLAASQASGAMCAASASLDVMVSPVPSQLVITPLPDAVCLNTVQSLGITGGSLSNLVILNENFNNPTNNWTTINNSTGGTITAAAWTLRNSPFSAGFQDISSNDASQFFLTDSDAQGSGGTTETYLVSPSFSTLNYTEASLNFYHYFRSYLTSFGKAQYSLDGTVWTDLTSYSTTTGTQTAFVLGTVALPAAAMNQANVKVRFYFSGSYAYFWAIDNVTIKGTQATDITWSPIANLYTDAAATVAYVDGASASTVYYKSTVAGTTNYTAVVTSQAGCTSSATVALNAVDCAITYANLQYPGNTTVETCTSPTYYAQVYKVGVTEAAGQGAGIQAWIGKNAANTDPATWAESSWQLATFNVQLGNNDEYQVTFAPSAAGTYYIASRFQYAPGAFVYGGYTASGGGIWDAINNVSSVLTVQAVAAPAAASQTFCASGTVADLVATGMGTINWYAASTGGTALEATSALATGDYYVSQTVAGCESARTMVAVTVSVTAVPTASAQTFCTSGTVAELVATGTGIIQWYAGPTGGTALAGTTDLTSGNYYVSQTIAGCESVRTMVAVTISITAAPTAAAQSFCTSGTVANLVATGTGTIQWYAGLTGGTALAGTTALASGNYYVSQTIAGCESARTMVAVTVNVTAAPTASAQSFCNGLSTATVANLVATGTGTIQWYAASTGGTALMGTTALASGNYYVSQTIAGCESARTMVAVTVNVTAAPTATAQTFCAGATIADLMATGTGLQWYNFGFGGDALASSTVLASGDYYVSQTIAGCESARTMVAVMVDNNLPVFTAQPFGTTVCVGEVINLSVSAIGTNLTYQWFKGTAVISGATTSTYAIFNASSSDAGNYTITVTGSCGIPVTSAVATVSVNVTAAPTGVATQDFTTGQTLANFVVDGQNIIWYSDATGTTVLPSTTVLVSGVTYYASQTLNGCESTSRLAVTAGVDLKTPAFEVSNLRYYPNPVIDVLTVSYSETIEGVQMYNMLGQMVYSRATNATLLTIDMASMATGTYLMQVTVNGITKNVKVIKK
ncbi:T9SS type A sorting domain-containing protein [Flavobacterium sp. SM2513]|uniref:Ig-like domain-containing protein n=1 Tax=Flavobacterium sp. SM2513 TaxID=3424766 RepID=UPI003D7F31FA